jgi:hypothetical protein
MDPFEAIELGDLDALRAALDGGCDVDLVRNGMTLLQHAIDVEADSHAQTGKPLHVDATALLVTRGADFRLVPPGGISAEHLAAQSGHWLALEIFGLVGR